MPVEEIIVSEYLSTIEAGQAVATAEIIQFPADVAATAALEGTTTTFTAANGVAAEVTQLAVVDATAGTATTAGVGLLGVEVGAAGLAIAGALGIVAGIGLYKLNPEFWTKCSNALIEAGQTIGGKVKAFINADTGQAGFSQETIEIYKNQFLNAGLFGSQSIIPNSQDSGTVTIISLGDAYKVLLDMFSRCVNVTHSISDTIIPDIKTWIEAHKNYPIMIYVTDLNSSQNSQITLTALLQYRINSSISLSSSANTGNTDVLRIMKNGNDNWYYYPNYRYDLLSYDYNYYSMYLTRLVGIKRYIQGNYENALKGSM